jgi:hypothetical protein
MIQQLEQSGKRKPHPGTGDFIKAHLQAVGEDYPYNVYGALCESLQAIRQRCPQLLSFQRYWYICAKLDLIEFVREEPSERLGPRRIYRLVSRNVNSRAWRNPQAALDLREGRTIPDPATGERVPVSRLGRRRYRRRVTKLPPQPVGRPRKRLTG